MADTSFPQTATELGAIHRRAARWVYSRRTGFRESGARIFIAGVVLIAASAFIAGSLALAGVADFPYWVVPASFAVAAAGAIVVLLPNMAGALANKHGQHRAAGGTKR